MWRPERWFRLLSAVAVWVWVWLAAAAGPAAADGGQASFSESREAAGGLALHYAFSDRSQTRLWTVAVHLSAATVAGAGDGIGRFDQGALVSRVSRAVTVALQVYEGAASAEVVPAQGGYRMSIRTRAPLSAPRVMAEAKQAAARAVDGYYADAYLKRIHHQDVIPDYGRLAGRYVGMMRPVAEAVAALLPQGSEREWLALALIFIQSIPYDDITAAKRESGYVVPPTLLIRNRGNCDTKSVAMASLLGTLLPGVPTVIVLIPGHALMGVGLPARMNEHSLRHEGREYLLLEPVGPALLPVGQISPMTRRGLSGDVTILPVTVAADQR